MTDRELEEQLRTWYAEVGESERAPAAMRERVVAIPASTPMPLHPLARRRNFTLLAVAAVLVVGGALATGSGLLRLTAVVPPTPSEALLVTPVPPTSEPPIETASPTASPKAWVTGQELMDALSAAYGYRWSPNVDSFSTVPSLQSAPIVVEAPFDGPAKVSIGAEMDAVAEVGLHAGRIAQALAPDAAPWIQEAITQVLGADWGSFATTPFVGVDFSVQQEKVMVTASGGRVGVRFLDPAVFGHDPLGVTFLFPPQPPPPRTKPVERGSVVYADSGLIRVANPNGTDAGTLLGGAYGVERVLGWSPDGSRLFYLDGGTIMSTDATGSEPTLIGRADRPQDQCTQISDAALEAKCVVDLAGISDRVLCPAVTVDDPCEPNMDEIVISPDGTRLAYPDSDDSGLGTIRFFDIATGQVTRMAFDPERRPGGPACEGPFGGGPLEWSPDGTRFAFGTSVRPKVDGWCQGAVFTINVDGTDLRRLTPSTVHAMDPRWSPDGSSVAFSSSTPRSAWDGKRDATRIPIDMDIYSVRPDGSGLTALTSDGVSIEPFWTRDGRIVFIHINPEATHELWIMDADGANPRRLDTAVAAQTAAGCTVCPYWPSESGPFQDDGPFLRFWRPGQP